MRYSTSTSRRSTIADTHNATPNKNQNKKKRPKDIYDVCIVGSDIGGLSAAAMLSLYGYSVTVIESHTRLGGCGHGFVVKSRTGGGNDDNSDNGDDGDNDDNQYY